MNELTLPTHIGFIMDGNRRWAQAKGVLKSIGHAQGADTAKKIVKHAVKRGIKIVSFYCFSKENWNREKSEVEYLMQLFAKFFDHNIEAFHKLGVKLRYIGETNGLPENLQDCIARGTEKTKENPGTIVQIALNYTGRDEIVRAVKKLVAKNEEINEENISLNLDTEGSHDPDLIVRTSGEQRLSGFLLWQAAYSEFYFTETAWPAFTAKDFDKAIEVYQHRQRRFGV